MLNKQWYNKQEILNIYPISISTYKRRIKNIPTIKTKIVKTERGTPLRLIHESILDEVFRERRRLSSKEKETKTRKYVNNHLWNYKGNIVPVNGTIKNIKAVMRFFFKLLLKHQKSKGHLTLFYSIEKNPNDKYYHAHYLIDCRRDMIEKKVVMDILEHLCDNNTHRETRIYLREYDLFYEKRGAIYATKDVKYGYELLEG